MAETQTHGDENCKIIEQTIKRAVRAAYTTGRELGLTEDQIQALGNGIKEICGRYAAEQTRPKINQQGNLHLPEEQIDVLRKLLWRTRDRLRIDLAQCGADHDTRNVAIESCTAAFHAVLDEGKEMPFEDKTPKQQTFARRAKVIDITPRFQEYLRPRFQTN